MSGKHQFTIVGLGELLWDQLPGGHQLGGAPANFAYWAAALGDNGVIASCVGADQLGQNAIDFLRRNRVDTAHLQRIASRPTGTVRIELNERGQPDFVIAEDVAWDYLEWTSDWEALARRTDALSFGTLARRSPRSAETISRFIQSADSALIVFDVNLRESFYSTAIIVEALSQSHIAKLNRDELPLVMEIVGTQCRSPADSARFLLDKYDLELVCVTLGADGSRLVTDSEVVEHPAIAVDVVDTVGSGDGFGAALVHHYLRGSSLEVISGAANRLGSLIAGRAGAMPPTAGLGLECCDFH